MEREAQDVRAHHARRSSRNKKREKAVHGSSKHKKNAAMPAPFKLRTTQLAEQREQQQRDDKEIAQLRHVQQKIMGRKTVEDFAQLKLIHRETAATRSRSLHCNEKPRSSLKKSTKCPLGNSGNDSRTQLNRSVHFESRPLLSARLPGPPQVAEVRKRPQSAKPVMQTQKDHTTNRKDARIQSPSKKRGNKMAWAKPRRLSTSESAPTLPDNVTAHSTDSQSLPVSKKINIVVNMRYLRLAEERESPLRMTSPVISREAWAARPLPLSPQSLLRRA
ncbi:hypothetical protein PHYBOEH_005957 [Phytophthora boehmeriae]|uniref:Uncharacterized protein n=1 Tax=Phytophthora boehmeriae TaxID=109152 RepID=A0A8T1X9F2_9STRA|nr:hypothetical protein PHYBOEH_005957 [Phytophthora boehmeriae]